MGKIRVGILDDHLAIIDGYQYRLAGQPDIEVVGTVHNGTALEALLARQRLDVLLLDVHVPTSDTDPAEFPILQMLPRYLENHPALHVLIISMLAQGIVVRSALNAGAAGYVLKDDTGIMRNLAEAVRATARGNLVLSHKARAALRRLPEVNSSVTERQREILQIVADEPNLTAADVAERLGIAGSTVRNLLSNAYLRLGVNHRSAAILRAQQLGLIRPGYGGPTPPGENK